jgi:pSer/pThr/pTyr-binding forkhead associated (FHA) protein
MSEQNIAGVSEPQVDTTQTHEVAQFLRRYQIALVALEGDDAGQNILLTRMPFTIGRGKRATMRIDNETVSRRHARISLNAENRLEVIDGGSVNGTFVNSERIEAALLEDGDQLRFGSVRYQLLLEERGPMTYIPE